MLRDKLESEPRSQIIDVKNQPAEQSVLAQSQNIEFQNIPREIAERPRTIELKEQELTLQAERHAWQCELAEKQLLLQSRNAELQQNRSEIASLRKRVRELELICQQSLTGSASNAQPQSGTKVAAFDPTGKAEVHEERSTLETGLEESVIARRSLLEKSSQENWNRRDDDFVMGEPRLSDVQEIGFARPEGRGDAMTDETEEKSSKIFGSKRWRIRKQKRRWRSRSDKQADSK